jgi:hypothetical protein
VRFQVLKAAIMKVVVFWDVASCSLVEVCGRFRGAANSITRNMMEAESIFETSAIFYRTTQFNIPED